MMPPNRIDLKKLRWELLYFHQSNLFDIIKVIESDWGSSIVIDSTWLIFYCIGALYVPYPLSWNVDDISFGNFGILSFWGKLIVWNTMWVCINSEGGTGENQSDVTPLNFWVILRFFAKICVFKKKFIK